MQQADGTVTDGRKGIPYLRDHFVPAILATPPSNDAWASTVSEEHVPAPT